MTVAKSIKTKPAKPYEGFPLTASSNGSWVKKIQGRVYAFGRWDDWKSALDKYTTERDFIALHRRRPRASDHAKKLTIRIAINRYLNVKKAETMDGELSPEHFADLKRTWQNIIPAVWHLDRLVLNLEPEDFRLLRSKLSKKKDGIGNTSPATIQGHVRRTKSLFSWLVDEGEIDRTPAYGSKFGKITKRQKVELENRSGEKRFTRDQIVALLEASDNDAFCHLRAMILLAINGGFGVRDIAELTRFDLDLKNGWYEGTRQKTAERRCVKLWQETVTALRKAIASRNKPKSPEHADLVFITRLGNPWKNRSALASRFRDLKKLAGVDCPSMYSLRHTCRDIANHAGDDHAANWIVGHKRQRTADHYIHTAPRERIERVCDYVRAWLFEGEVPQ